MVHDCVVFLKKNNKQKCQFLDILDKADEDKPQK